MRTGENFETRVGQGQKPHLTGMRNYRTEMLWTRGFSRRINSALDIRRYASMSAGATRGEAQ